MENSKNNQSLKTIFVTGGVVSSLGKGICASIISGLLSARGFTTKLKKIDPYLNVDPGTLSPLEHGEVFVTEDGMEADLDLGHYERLGNSKTSKNDYITAGSIYQKILTKERKGLYEGKTVQVVPHFTTELKKAIFKGTEGYDFLICEIGGTVGDIENIAILETIRQIKAQENNVISAHVALMPYLSKAGEWKTKPIQHSIRDLLSYGIQTDILLCRMENENKENWKEKLSLLSNIKKENIFKALDAKSIYHAMLAYEEESICERVLQIFNLEKREKDLTFLTNYVNTIEKDLPKIDIAIVGKYVQCKDAYKSVEEALYHAAIANNIHANLHIINAEELKEEDLKNMHGIFIPGGFGKRAIDGKIKAIAYAKNNNIPLLGMCLGMQLSIIEALKSIFPEADSTEFTPNTPDPVVFKLSEWKKEDKTITLGENLGGTMRLGSYKSTLVENTLTKSLYNSEFLIERHRHRYVFNNKYKDFLEKVGLTISAYTSDNLVEAVERKDCDFFITGQFHAEFNSTIKKPNSLFLGFLKAIKNRL
ncbi:CTP synthase [Alphaproteobacteria bacterium endosymbiont of Tiliacea citrago]|uniref:CTP synthase n=1 Tax=Alphaproteobacteria bacterium endosymbiont of Tiliacea citrago TaxID=3077944 RepID=UPI00313E9336